jgi:hypothetical protein
MYEMFQKLHKKAQIKKLSEKDTVDRRSLLYYWLSSLFVVIEGFVELDVPALLRCRPSNFEEIVDRAKLVLDHARQRSPELKLYRSATFHYQKDSEKHRSFLFADGSLVWALELQFQLQDFFSAYRVNCEVIYMLEGRMEESEIASASKRRRKTRAAS